MNVLAKIVVQHALKIKLFITTNAELAQQIHMFLKTHVFAKMDSNMILLTILAPILFPPALMVNTIMELSVYAMLVSEDTMVNVVNALINPATTNAFVRAAKFMMPKITDVLQTVAQIQCGMEIHVYVTQVLSFTTMLVDNAPADLLPTKTPTLVFAQITMSLTLLIIDVMLTVHQAISLMETLAFVHLVLSKYQIPVDNVPAEAQLTAPQILVFVKTVIHMTLLIIDATLTVVPMKFYQATPVYVLETSTDTITYVDNALVVPLLITHKLHAFALSLDKHLT